MVILKRTWRFLTTPIGGECGKNPHTLVRKLKRLEVKKLKTMSELEAKKMKLSQCLTTNYDKLSEQIDETIKEVT